jgi:hypothetical protein
MAKVVGRPSQNWFGARFEHTDKNLGVCTVRKVTTKTQRVHYNPDTLPSLDYLRNHGYQFRFKPVGKGGLETVSCANDIDSFVEQCVARWVLNPEKSLRKLRAKYRRMAVESLQASPPYAPTSSDENQLPRRIEMLLIVNGSEEMLREFLEHVNVFDAHGSDEITMAVNCTGGTDRPPIEAILNSVQPPFPRWPAIRL